MAFTPPDAITAIAFEPRDTHSRARCAREAADTLRASSSNAKGDDR